MDTKLVPLGYKTQAVDTAPEVERMQFALLRRVPIETRLGQVLAFCQQARSLSWQAIADRYPELSSRDRKRKLVERICDRSTDNIDAFLDRDLMLQTPIELAAEIGTILDRLDIPYFVSGGIASAIWGERRTTEDVDLAVLLSPEKVAQLLAAMADDFYISEVAVSEALQRTSTFNIIHFASVLKADIYLVSEEDNFRRSALARRVKLHPYESPELNFYICSPEDLVLQKLIWYNIASNQSQKQWRDILGILKLQGDGLDVNYLRIWSGLLQVESQLDRAFTEAGLSID